MCFFCGLHQLLIIKEKTLNSFFFLKFFFENTPLILRNLTMCSRGCGPYRKNVRSGGRSMLAPKGLDAVPLLVAPVSLYLCRVVVRLRSLWILFPAVTGIGHANFWMSRNGRSSLLKLNGPIFGRPWRTLSCWNKTARVV